MLGVEEVNNDQASHAIVQQFLREFTGGEQGVIHKKDFVDAIMKNQDLLEILSPFYGISSV
jgi:Ca2+-binding EF-hand superfamily protein